MDQVTSKRAFRTPASFEAEKATRGMLKPFLEKIGFSSVTDVRSGHSQILSAIDSDGTTFTARVRLCWRWKSDRNTQFSAAQLRARLIDGDWDKTIAEIVGREAPKGISHSLLVQSDGTSIVFAALVPVTALAAVLNEQRLISAKLIAEGRLGGLKKNHTENGGSPTIWLMDKRSDEGHRVADILWEWPGVEDLAKRPFIADQMKYIDDSMSDLPGLDLSLLGRDAALQFSANVSKWARDPKVRTAVIKRSGGRCERPGCGASRPYKGFLDVHHILSVKVSDRVSNCVALCPNCHRNAHFSSDSESLNKSLLLIAQQDLSDNL